MKPTFLEFLDFEIDKLSRQIKPTKSDLRQFETNCRCEFKVNNLNRNRDFILKHKGYIDSSVLKNQKSFSYSTKEDFEKLESWKRNMNPVEKEPVIFTEELFNELLINYINYQIQYYSEGLLNSEITANSTHKLSNLEFEWHLECKQELIRFYKESLNIIHNENTKSQKV